MASSSKDLYRWKRLTKSKSNSSVTKKPLPADDVQSWLKKVEQASDEATAITFGKGKSKVRDYQSNGHVGALATIDALKDHDAAYNEAQELLTQWMAEKCNLDDDDDDDVYLLDEGKSPKESASQKTDLLSHWEQLLDENDPGMLHLYNGPSSDAIYRDIESRDDGRTVQEILDGLLEKDMGEESVKRDLGLNPSKKKKDPRVTMAARQQKVKENREKQEQKRRQLLEERQAHRDAQLKARQMVKQEEKAREIQKQQEEMKIQQEMAHIRKELQDTRRREEDERRRCIDWLWNTFQNFKHRHFQAWYELVLDRRMKMGKARALSDWRCLLRSWNAWRAYHRACQAERESKEAEIFVKESHRKHQTAFKHYRDHLLRKYFLAWQIWMRSQEESAKIEETKIQTRNKMDALLEAAASGRLWTDRSSDEVQTERRKHTTKVKSTPSTPSSVASTSSRSAAHSSSETQSRLHNLPSKSQSISMISGRPSKPKHAWQVTRKHLKLTPEEMAHIGEDEDRSFSRQEDDETLRLNLGSVNVSVGAGEQKKSASNKGGNFEHRYANQQKMLMEQRKQLDEQKRLIEDLQAGQREQLIKMQIQAIQGGDATSVSSGMKQANAALDDIMNGQDGSNIASQPTSERTSDSDSVSTPSSALRTERTTSSTASGQRTAKQPPLLKGMEERAALRAQRKAEREQKMREKEEEKLAQLRAEEERKVAEEEEKKKAEMDKRKERKKLEKQRELEKKQKQEKVAEMNSRADSHYRFSLLRNYGLKPWRKLIVASHQHWQVAVDHHSYALLQTYLLPWHRYTQTTKSEQCSMADAKYKEILLQRSLNSWKQYGHYLSIQYQRARRHYGTQLKAKLFKAWQDYITNEKLRAWKCEEMSVDHNHRRIIAKVFEAWKKYPKMLKQEKDRELRREEMRKKVTSLLPDFGLS
ncbi:putative coiled-coil domain-containing protein [Apostichopus japonicus]|uniref:Putative coiled-coil domain-containing protein n=1 Tax=Stichopus japonicus TaxID=307972 RepID=A0A2G8LAE2_STIJA|nr:putative coiled-coil domain-containing protein [Apostichopus japonicus]